MKKIIIILIAAGVSSLLLWSYLGGRKDRAAEAQREAPVKAASRVSIRGGETVISLDQETIAKGAIAAAPLPAKTHRAQTRAYGMAVELQALSDLRSSYAKAQAAEEYSRRDVERERSLRKQGAVADEVVQNAEATSRADNAAAEAFAAQAQQQWGSVIGQWLKENDPELQRLLQFQDVLLQVSLPRGISDATPPETISVQTSKGRLVPAHFVSRALRSDPRLQGESFFYIAPGGETQLLPGMTVVVLMPAGEELKGVVVPGDATVWWQGKPWVYVETKSGEFTRRSIPTDSPVESGWFVTTGLSPGERIVTTGAQFLLSEEFRSQIQVGEEGK